MTPDVEYLTGEIERAIGLGQRALEKYGYPAQEQMMVEECGELLTAIARVHRGRDHESSIVEECADVLIVALQIGLHIGGDTFAAAIAAKTKRLEGRLAK